jgi:pimeloyl-ACP methyl ester carboxylesterase
LIGDRWRELAVPTTLIWGERDAWCAPEEGEAVASINPRLRLVRIPDAGHAAWLDDPDRVVDAIEGALGAP